MIVKNNIIESHNKSKTVNQQLEYSKIRKDSKSQYLHISILTAYSYYGKNRMNNSYKLSLLIFYVYLLIFRLSKSGMRRSDGIDKSITFTIEI